MKRKLLQFIVTIACFFLGIGLVIAGYYWYDLGSGWKVRHDTPHIGTGAHHLHFYYKDSHKWCIRLDNAQVCDRSKSVQEPPQWVKTKAYNIPNIKSKIQEYNQAKVNGITQYIPAWALYTIGGILMFISIITWFIPFDDAFTAAYWVWLLA